MNNKMITIPYADAIEYGENTSALFKALWELTDLIRLESDLKKHHRAYLHVRENIDEKVKEARQIMTKVSVDMIGFYLKHDVPERSNRNVLYHKIDLKIFWEFRYALVPFLLILFCVEYLFRITPVSLFLQYLGKHSMNIWLVHTFVRDSLGKYVFALKKFWLIPVAVLVISLGISYCLDFLKKITGYQKLIRLLKKKVTEHYAVRE